MSEKKKVMCSCLSFLLALKSKETLHLIIYDIVPYNLVLTVTEDNLFPISSIEPERPLTYITPRSKSQSSSRQLPSLPTGGKRAQSSVLDERLMTRQEAKGKSSTLPGNRSHPSPGSPSHHLANATHLGLPGFPYRPPSPVDYSGDHSASNPAKAASSKRSLFRKRAGSVDTYNKVKS